MAALGSLVVALGLDAAEFTSGLTKSEYQARKALKNIERDLNGLRSSFSNVLSLFGGGFAVTSLIRATKATIDGVDAMNDLSDATGASVENISALDDVARRTGTNLDNVSGILVKFNAGLKDADPSKGPGAVLKALNLDIEELKKLDPAEALRRTAVALAGFADDGSKARAIQELFGKSVKDAAPFLKDLAEQGQLNATVTKQQAEEFEAFNKKIFAVQADITNLARALVGDLLPAITRIIDELRAGREAFGGFGAAALAIGTTRTFDSDIEALGHYKTELQKLQELRAKFAAGSGFGAFKESRIEGFDKQIKEVQQFISYYEKLLKLTGGAAGGGRGFVNPDMRPGGRRSLVVPPDAKENNDDPTKRLLDNQLKDLKRSIDAERDLLDTRNKFLDIFNRQGLLSIQSYYDARRAISESAVSSEISLIDKQVEALKKFRDSTSKKTDQAEAEGKINDLLDQREKVLRKAGEAGLEFALQQEEAQRRLKEEINGLNAEVLELSGSFAAAAAIRFDQQNLGLVKQLMAEGNAEALNLVDTLRKATIERAKFDEASQKTSNTMESLRNAEERIGIARQSGAIGEFEALRKLGEERQKVIGQLEAQVQAQEAIAKASGSDRLVLDAERARLELERLKAAAEPLKGLFEDIFVDSASSAFEDFINGSKSASEAFKSFAMSVLTEINRMIAADLAKSIFGSAQGGSGGGFLGGLAGAFASAFGGGRAVGGPVSANGLFQVNENRRPEMLDVGGKQFLMMGNERGRVIPNPQLSGGRQISVVNNFTVSGQVDKRTQDQLAARAASSVGRVVSRSTA